MATTADLLKAVRKLDPSAELKQWNGVQVLEVRAFPEISSLLVFSTKVPRVDSAEAS